MVTPTLFDTGIFSNLTSASAIDPGSKLYWYAAGGTTPVDTYTSSALDPGAKNTNPVVADANGRFPQIWLGSGSFKYVLKASGGSTLVTVDNFSPIGSALSASTGGALIGYIEGGTGSQATTVQTRLRQTVNAVTDFSCDNTGATNATTKLQEYADECTATGKPSLIPPGRYMVTPGALIIDNGNTDTAFPFIYTAGYGSVTFFADPSSTADGPLLTISNGTSADGGGRFWRGGYLGGIRFEDSRVGSYPNTHGLSIRGMFAPRFGAMFGYGLNGNLIDIPLKTFAGNPDPYSVSLPYFEPVMAQLCKGGAFINHNGQGFNSYIIEFLYSNTCGTAGMAGSSGFSGMGAGGKILAGTVTAGYGYAIDTDNDAWGSLRDFTVGPFEMDAPEKGWRIDRGYEINFTGHRFIHRYNFIPGHTTEYVPRVCVDLLGNGATSVTGDLNHRFETGGAHADLGLPFVDLNSVAFSDINIDTTQLVNNTLSVVDADLYGNISNNADIYLTYDYKIIWDTRPKYFAKAYTNTATIPNGTGLTGSEAVIFGTELQDDYLVYDPTTGGFLVNYPCSVRGDMQVCLTVASGTRVQIGFSYLRSAAYTVKKQKYSYQVNAGAQHHEASGTLTGLLKGDIVFGVCNQNSGGGVAVTAIGGAPGDDNYVSFEVIK